jgi:hypothetical protein
MERKEEYLQAYDDWVALIDAARSHMHSLLDLIDADDSTLAELVQTRWNRLEFLRTFVQNVALPLELETTLVHGFMKKFPEPSLRTLSSLSATLSLLLKLNEEILKQERGTAEDLICFITLERMVDPVIAADGFTYDRAAISEWLQIGRLTSPRTNMPMDSAELIPNDEIRERIESLADCNLGHFFEYFIFEVALDSSKRTTAVLPDDLLQGLVAVAAGELPVGVPESASKFTSGVLPSDSGRTGIVRELLRLKDERCARTVRAALDSTVSRKARAAGFLDTPFSFSYLTAREQQLITLSQSSAMIDFASTNISKFSDMYPGFADALKALDDIAALRYEITRFAGMLCEGLDTGADGKESLRMVTEMSGRLGSLLSKSGLEKDMSVFSFSRAMRVFLFKHIERRKGISFLRNTLQVPPLCDAAWMKDWKQSGDVSFSRFLGSNKIPKVNPLQIFPLFAEVQNIVSQYLVSGSISAMESSLSTLFSTQTKRKIQSALLLVCFHEVFLLSVLPEDSTAGLKQRCIDFNQWAQKGTFLESIYNEQERGIFTLFACTSDVLGGVDNVGEKVTESLEKLTLSATSSMAPPQVSCDTTDSRPTMAFRIKLDQNSSVDAILQTRVAAHVAAAALAASDTHPFAFFRTMMLYPKKAKDTFFPTMPEDVLKMAQEIMGGRWYRCPNQHPYYVDLCGRPTVIQTCKECGAQIGGLSHVLLDDNVDIGNTGNDFYQQTVVEDNSDRDYCLRSAELEAEDRFYSARSLDPRGVRVLRIMMNMSLFCGSTAFGNPWDAEFLSLCNPSYGTPPRAGVKEYIATHVASDWQLLNTMLMRSSDDVALLLHLIVQSRFDSSVSSQSMPVDAAGDTSRGGGRSARSGNFVTLATSKHRIVFEEYFSKEIMKFTNEENLDKRLSEAEKRFGPKDDEGGGTFTMELMERLNIKLIPEAQRRAAVPVLFQYTRRFDYSHFQFTLAMVKGAKERYSLLMHFVEQEKNLRTLKYLPKVLDWLRLLKGRFNGHLDRETARSKTCGAVIEEVDDSEKPRWLASFSAFCEAWNASWTSVKRIGCVTFSDEYSNMEMGPGQMISFCLPNELDEGLCPLALVQYLVTRHNELIQMCDEAQVLRRTRQRKEVSRAKMISSRFLTAAHCFDCGIEDFLSFLEKQCVTQAAPGFDFAKAESRLIDRYLCNLPAIDLEQSGFTYAHEQEGTLVVLRQKLRQEPLAPDMLEAIKRDFSNPANSQKMMETLEVVIDFLGSTGGAIVETLDTTLGDMLLSKYISTVLMDPTEIGSRIVAQQVRLKHLESLWGLLMELTTADVFANIDARYKKPLEEATMSELLAATGKENFDTEALLGCMKSLILEQLKNGILSPDATAYSTLEWTLLGEEELRDVPWFCDHFPRSLPMSQIVEAYHVLRGANKL